MKRNRDAVAVSAVALFLGLVSAVPPAAPAFAAARIVSGDQQNGGDIRPFILTDHNGHTVSETSFLGKYQIVYFGYTHCPEICPTSLQTFSDALDMLGPERASQVWVLMISVDPARDTPEQMKQYVANFHPQVVGLTGPKANIDAAAESFHIRYQQTAPIEGSDGAYDVDHTASAVLMAPDGHYLMRWAYGTPAETIAHDLASYMNNGN